MRQVSGRRYTYICSSPSLISTVIANFLVRRFSSNFACLSCDGKWEEHLTLYEDEQLRQELGKTVGQDFYPLADVPEIQQEFIRQMEEEAAKQVEANQEAGQAGDTAEGASGGHSEGLAGVETQLMRLAVAGGDVTTVTSVERERLTLPAREKPERSVRLMREQGMLRKY